MTKLKTWYWDGCEKLVAGGIITLRGEGYSSPKGDPYYLLPKSDVDALFELVEAQQTEVRLVHLAEELVMYDSDKFWKQLHKAINKLRGV